MGGSFARALEGLPREIRGIDTDPETVNWALRKNYLAQASPSPEKILPGTDLLILAVPVNTILAIIPALPAYISEPIIVLDLGSTKSRILRAAQNLPPHISFVGGHPMCGKASLGIQNAEADLYREAPFYLAPPPSVPERAKALVRELVTAVGAVPVSFPPESHDRWVAGTSHLPYLSANALAHSVPLEAAPLIGPGLKSSTRLASTPTSMMMDILQTNREAVLGMLRAYQHQLADLEALLTQGQDAELKAYLDDGAEKHRQLLARSAALKRKP
jgi:prephenate dehydrogenase